MSSRLPHISLGAFVGTVFLAESAFYSVVPPLLPRLIAETEMTTTEVGILVAAYPAGVMLAAIPAIALVDRRGVRFATTVGLALLIIATVAFAWSSQASVLAVARFVQGIGGAVAWAGALAWLISGASSTRRATVIGGAVGAALIGMVVGPIIGAAATWIGRGAVFTGIAVVLMAMAAVTPASPESIKTRRSPIKALVRLFGARPAAIGNILVAVIGVITGTLASLAPLLVAQRGGQAAVIAAIFVSSYLVASFWNVVTGRIADRIGRLAPLTVGFALAAIVLPFLPSLAALIPLAIATVIAGSSASGLWTPTAAMVADGAAPGAADQAVAVAVTNAAWAAGGTLGALAASRIADASGFWPPFLLAGAICAVAAVGCLVMWRGGHLQPALEGGYRANR
jgi:MFS family permease